MADIEQVVDTGVKGGKEIGERAAKGMELFAAEGEDKFDLDVAAATKYKEEMDAKCSNLDQECEALHGKDNSKARSAKGKEAMEIRNSPEYIDACHVSKGNPPVNGNFAKIISIRKGSSFADNAATSGDKKKDDKKKDDKKKTTDSAGISKAERDELEKLKNDIISRKKELKESGMSGGQINKDEQIAGWVARMNELKEKENPGALAAAKEEKKGGKKKVLSKEAESQKADLEREVEEYRAKLKNEFGYTNKDIKADPDLNEMLKKLADCQK